MRKLFILLFLFSHIVMHAAEGAQSVNAAWYISTIRKIFHEYQVFKKGCCAVGKMVAHKGLVSEEKEDVRNMVTRLKMGMLGASAIAGSATVFYFLSKESVVEQKRGTDSELNIAVTSKSSGDTSSYLSQTEKGAEIPTEVSTTTIIEPVVLSETAQSPHIITAQEDEKSAPEVPAAAENNDNEIPPAPALPSLLSTDQVTEVEKKPIVIPNADNTSQKKKRIQSMALQARKNNLQHVDIDKVEGRKSMPSTSDYSIPLNGELVDKAQQRKTRQLLQRSGSTGNSSSWDEENEEFERRQVKLLEEAREQDKQKKRKEQERAVQEQVDREKEERQKAKENKKEENTSIIESNVLQDQNNDKEEWENNLSALLQNSLSKKRNGIGRSGHTVAPRSMERRRKQQNIQEDRVSLAELD